MAEAIENKGDSKRSEILSLLCSLKFGRNLCEYPQPTASVRISMLTDFSGIASWKYFTQARGANQTNFTLFTSPGTGDMKFLSTCVITLLHQFT